jgi:hypothetical protein
MLHSERLQNGIKRIHSLTSPFKDLPDGAMIAALGRAYVVVSKRPYLWAADGYHFVDTLPSFDGLITPPSTLGALRAGYCPALHPSIDSLRKERND